MKKFMILALMTIALMFVTPANAKPVKVPNCFYPHMGVVTKVRKVKRKHYYKVHFRDGEGRVWSWLDDDPSWDKGDFVAVIMYDNGTPNSVYDDQVVNARYVGYKGLF